jgi:sodium/bile acid cotransporter 7
MLKKIWAQHWFICLLPAAFALAWFAPVIASKGGWLRPELTTKLGVGLIFVLQGLLLPTAAMRAAIGQVRLHAVVQGMTLVGFPLLGLAAAALVGRWLPDELRIGLVYLSVLPSTVSSAAVLTASAGGNTAGAICNAVLSSLLGIVLTPALLAVSMSLQGVTLGGAGGGVDAGTIIVELLKLILAPLLVGQLLRLRLGDWATGVRASALARRALRHRGRAGERLRAHAVGCPARQARSRRTAARAHGGRVVMINLPHACGPDIRERFHETIRTQSLAL